MTKLLLSLATVSTVTIINLSASGLSASFTDTKMWDGKTVPKEEVCSNYNMEAGSTPEIMLKNIPTNSQKVILTFTDETFKGMNNGGHGVVSYTLTANTNTTTIPSFQGETFDLPENFTSVIAHRGTKYKKTPGAYLAPCSGGKGNTYSVLIQAVNKDSKVLDKTTLTLGKY